MKRLVVTVVVMLLGLAAQLDTAEAGYKMACPDFTGAVKLYGWWAPIYPSITGCGAAFYTWNTTSLSTEESRVQSTGYYIICNISSFSQPVYGISKVFIPSPDTKQTSSAHYYKWASSSSWQMIGIVDQYNTIGWKNLAGASWRPYDTFRLSDWTKENRYSKHVDVDAIKILCP